MLDIAIELAEAERLLADLVPDAARICALNDSLRRDARNPNVMGDQRRRASDLAVRLDARARGAGA